MQYNMFGNSGMEISRLSLGAMTFPNSCDESDTQQIIEEALQNGVNLIDTADSYDESEAVLGRVLTQEQREKIYLVSKVYRQFCRDKHVGRNSRVNIRNSLERSLKLLNTDYLDLYLMHHPDPQTPVEESMNTMNQLVQEGKIRYWGVSNHYAWQMSYMLGLTRERKSEPMIAVQNCYSILDRQIEKEMIYMLQRFNIGLMVYGPLSGGILTGKYHPEEGRPETGRAQQIPREKKRISDEKITDMIHKLRNIARGLDITMNQLAFAWLLKKPWVNTVLLGGSKPSQFPSAYEIADYELPDNVEEQIDNLSQSQICIPYVNQARKEGARINVNA